MYNKRIVTTVVMAAIITATTVTGCSTNSSKNTVSFAETTFAATIESIDDNTLTLSVDTSSGGQGGMGEMGQMPSGGMDGEAPSGEAPSGGMDDEAPGGDTSDDDSSTTDEGNTSSDDGSDTNTSTSSDSGNDSIPPAKPDGDSTGSESGNDSTPPAKPDGDSTDSSSGKSNSTPPTKPDGDTSSDASSTSPGKTETSGNETVASSGDSTESTEDSSNSDSTESTEDSSSDVSKDSDTITVTLEINDESVLFDEDDNAIELDDLEEGDYVTVTIDEDGNIESVVLTEEEGTAAPGENMGGSSSSVSYTAVTEITEDTESDGETFESTGTDENAIYIHDGASFTLKNATVTRTSSDSTGGDNSSFYGVGAAVLNTDGTTVINGGTFTTDAAGGAGIFSYGDGITYVSNATIKTQQDTSGGIHVAGGGTLYAWDLDVETNGESSAAIRSDRGGGTMVVDGGTYTSNGVGSPAVYCTADIAINDATLTANGSEAVCIEGLNSLHLYDCDLTGNMSDSSQNDCTWNIIVYQSMSGDSEVGNGTFTMTGGSITAKNGGMFYTTNTECTFYLSDVDITYADDNEFFLRCTGNDNERGWGTSGSNGSQCNFTADNQEMLGDIIYDSISTLDFYMENGSTLTGAVIDDETYAGNGGDGYCSLYISDDSTWVVTGDSEVTNLYNEGTIVDAEGNTVTIVGTDGTVYVQGTSSYTVTVSSYSTDADMSGATDGGSFSDYEVEQKL